MGFVATWDSENSEVGKGGQEIERIVENERIDLKLRFKEPFEDDVYFITEAISPNQTKLKWGFKDTWIIRRFFMLTVNMDKEIGGALEVELYDLKTFLEY